MTRRGPKKATSSGPGKEGKISSSAPADNVEQYIHDYEKRPNNPPVGLVTPETDKEMPRKKYEYDPHLDPQLQWAGKKENSSFEVDTVSLHVHERIDPLTIIEKVRKKEKEVQKTLFHYFEQPENNPPLREAIDFYKHSQNWSNRLVAGDSLLVMNSLLQKEGMAGKVQMAYIDPPYGIKYGSNFQPFVNKRDVKDRKDEDLTQEPEMVRAFRDTWELGIHSYLTYLRDRLLLARELVSDSGSIFVQIGDENVHLVRCLMDEILGKNNFIGLISFATSTGATAAYIPRVSDYLLWYGKDRKLTKYRQLYGNQDEAFAPVGKDNKGEYELSSLTSQDPSETRGDSIIFNGKEFSPSKGRHWSFDPANLFRLVLADRIVQFSERQIRWKKYKDERVRGKITNRWDDTQFGAFSSEKIYVVQTPRKVIERCILMTTEPGDIVFDPTCGSGTTAYAAEQWGRRWITCDTSRVSVALAKQRMMTAVYDYYELLNPHEGVSAGFNYKTMPHVTLKSIANNEEIRHGMSREDIDAAILRHAQKEKLYDQPIVDKSKTRICGPFTVEAVPAPVVRSMESTINESITDNSIARSGETIRQNEWRRELLATGIVVTGKDKIAFSRIETLQGTDWIHADGETNEKQPRRIVVSFGPDYAPLEQRQVERAIQEAQNLVPRPKIVLFAAFQFDPEAAKDIDETRWEGVTVLRVQMNTDLLTQDLKRNVSRNQSFWLMGQPDIELKRVKDGKLIVEVHGFDYYNPNTHEIDSGGKNRIAMWMLDTDYDGRSLYPQQVFFPMTGGDDGGWGKIGKSLHAKIDEDLLESYGGTISLPFEIGFNKRVAVKIIDDRGIESLRILKVK